MANAKFNSTKADGRALAVAMFREFVHYGDNSVGGRQWSIEAKYRQEGTEQDNVLLRYLTGLKTKGGIEAMDGFCSVLTDYIGSCLDGGPPDCEFYEGIPERFFTGTPGPWPTMDDEPVIDEAREDAQLQSFLRTL